MKLEIRNTLTDNLEIGFTDSGTPPIAVILPERFQTAGGYAETRPDIETARLFAAAPELLAHLKFLVDGISEGVAIPSDGATVNAALEAIAKAEGRKDERGSYL